MLGIGFFMILILIGGLIYLIVDVTALVTEALLYSVVSLMLILVFYNIYKISTTQFWKRQ